MKILITSDTFAPSLDGPVFLSSNSFADVDKDTAAAIVHAGKALYVEPKDDPSRAKQWTASESRVKGLIDALKAADKAAKQA
jgi:hypothetical protein